MAASAPHHSARAVRGTGDDLTDYVLTNGKSTISSTRNGGGHVFLNDSRRLHYWQRSRGLKSRSKGDKVVII